MIEIKNISKAFGKTTVLNQVSASIHEGDIVGIIGPSGSGKSTFLRTLCNLESIDSGSITNQAKGSVMVFQNFALFPHLNVLENLLLAPVKVQKISKAEAEKRAIKWLAAVHMTGYEKRFPSELSGGQQQRVAIARALCTNPEVLLLDEPTASLDPQLVGEVLNVLEDLRDLGITMLIVSHELSFLSKATNRILYFQAGRLIEDSATTAFFKLPTSLEGQAFMNTST